MKSDTFVKNHTLFQRVMKPTDRRAVRPFGAGTHGMAEKALAEITKILTWDYMGAAEFEHGECGETLAHMWDQRATLVTFEYKGFHFLADKSIVEDAKETWQNLLDNPTPYHRPLFENEKIVGWFDFHNAYFVSRTPAMRDNLHKFLLEYEAAK